MNWYCVLFQGDLGLASILDYDDILDYVREKSGDLGLSMCQLIEQGVTIIADLAETMNIPRRATRQVLYQMNKERIIGYKRARIEQRIVFQWFITPKKIRRMIKNARQKEIRELEERLEFEQDHKFFECLPCNERYLFSEAFDFDFTCEHCGEMLEAHDNDVLIESIKVKLNRLIEEARLSTKDLDEGPDLEDEGVDPDLEAEVDEDPPPEPEPKSSSKKKRKKKDKEEKEDGVYYDGDGWPDEKKKFYYSDDKVNGDKK